MRDFWLWFRRIEGLLILFLSAGVIPAVEVQFQKIHAESHRVDDEPQEYWRIMVAGVEFQMAPVGDWTPLANYGGLDFAVVAPSASGAVVGIRIGPLVDAKGQPLSKITPDLVASEVARLRGNAKPPADSEPKLVEPVEEFDFQMKREEGSHLWKGRYRLRAVNGQLWFYACEAPPAREAEALKVFDILLGTFSPAATR